MTSQTTSTEKNALRARAMNAYTSQTREDMEQEWILNHLPLVRHIVNKITNNLRNSADYDDLISAGTLGLVKAARAFDPNRAAVFKTYAYIRIRGAVLDEIRGRSFIPATVHGNIKRVEKAYQSYISQFGSHPTDAELAKSCDLTQAQLYKLLEEARKQNFLSIHGIEGEQSAISGFVPPDSAPSPDALAERKEILECLTQAIESLPERDRTIILLYYDRDLTMKEAAKVLGVTESRVSQLHSSAVFKLSMKLRKAS